MVKLTITQIGTPKQYQGSKGPFEKNYLKATEYGNEFLNFFVNQTTRQWKVGEVVEVEAVEKQDYTSKQDGSLKTSLNIKLPKFGGNADVMKALEELNNRVSKIYHMVDTIGKAVVKPPVDNYPSPESQGLDPNNMANFAPEEVASLESEAEKTFSEI